MGEIRIKRDVSDAIVYGIHIDPNIQDPSNAVTYLEDAVGMTPASMGSTTFDWGSWAGAFFIPKPCMVRYDGTVDYYLDPSDYSKKADGTPSDIANPNYKGNGMMDWGLIWHKFEPGEADGEGYIYYSNKKVNDTFNCWCNYDANNNIIPHFYTAIYNGTGTDKLRSISGVQLTSENGSGNTTGQQEISRAMANNTSDITEWYIDLWVDRILVTGLLYLMGKSRNLQAAFGRGLDSGGQTAKEAYITGTLNDKGLFWGDITNGNNAVKVFGMENFWGCCYHRTAGLFGTSTGYAYKLTHGTVDGSTATSFGTTSTGYIPVTATQPESGYVTKMSFGKYGMLPSAIGGSSSTYYSDYFYKGTGFSLVGGNSGYGLSCGFYVNLSLSETNASWGLTTSLSLKPRAKTPYNPDWDNRPAHQYINGEWIDIPTHHFINNRWQGELTSQSPLKFRADGDMLDWRIEGKTSGNLFDISTDLVTHLGFSSTSGGIVSIKSTNNAIGFYVKCQPDKYYTLSRTTNSNNRFSIGFTADEPVDGTPLLSYTPFESSDTSVTALSPSNANYLCAYLTNQNDPITDDLQLMLNEGSTALPYEPYGGVGDWDETEQKYKIPVTVNGVTTNIYTNHQLMDGDSIDFTTTETTIPLAVGNNTLTVDTAVKPKIMFVKFEG